MRIKLLITGGTIDKVYDELIGKLVFQQTYLIDMLNRSRSMVDTLSEVLFLKDSLDMSDIDRALIVKKCQESDTRHILITHGTDSMVRTAKLLAKEVNNKTIVLFGSMIPYSINYSDALFNLGVALSAVQIKEYGVYITMNGQVFDFDKVKKNKEIGIFTLL
ncbi:asparaginase domain-containing protein [Candidatus Vesicomyidisocius sp. SY067_SCS001]|uniref:asparaginase domain-containing protein n=1 Tax=Candidatus Vesicomyidisocius sp. SY067_SCS001 TaxID=2732590 RepID=UPI0016856200|nr:asparaginase domain-containing protein [Candidatus Vesicomyosocius sp. SY067_SCS001]